MRRVGAMLAAGLAVLAVVGGLLAAGCDEAKHLGTQVKAAPPEAAWSEHVLAHTAGLVSRDSDIRIRFADDVVTPERLEADWSALLTVTPAVEGKPVFASVRELVLKPAQPLAGGTRYTVRLNPEALQTLPQKAGPYEFHFDVIEQAFEIRIDDPQAADAGGQRVRIGGEVQTADRADAPAVERMVTASRGGAKLALRWRHDEAGRSHGFTLPELPRQAKPGRVTVAWDGTPIGVDEHGSREVEVPARGEFRVTGTTVMQDGGTRIDVGFSQHLDAAQDWTGLVRLGDAKLRTTVAGNHATVYVNSPVVGSQELLVSGGVRSVAGEALGADFRRTVKFERLPPQVRFAGKGVVLPAGDRLEVPIEAINVASVQVTAFEIYENNLAQFLQANTLDGSDGLARVGRHLWRKRIELPGSLLDQWGRYSLDLTKLTRAHPGAMIRLTLSINRGNSLYPCSPEDAAVPVPKLAPLKDRDDPDAEQYSSWDYAEQYFSGAQVRWRDRDNPCRDAYYVYNDNVRSARNFLASNIGLLAKEGNDGGFLVLATDIRGGTAMPGVAVEVRNYQNQRLARLTTDANGLARTRLDATPFYLVARKDGQAGYLRVNAGRALPTSHFEVGGQTVRAGVKGYLYGERGVWRPGDELHLTFVLHDPGHVIPDDHPVTLQLINPEGRVTVARTNAKPVDGFYAFTLRTPDDAPTGNWTAKALVGDRAFESRVRIETVVPNRLAATLSAKQWKLLKAKEDIDFTLESHWLHGAPAANLAADVTVRLSPARTTFERFADFVFDDPARRIDAEPIELWKGELDAQGHAAFQAEIDPEGAAGGMLRANFTTRVHEPGGAFSTVHTAAPFHPYARYVGVRLPKGDAKRNMLLTDTPHTVQIATLAADGKPVDVKKLEVSLYKIKWKWWWDKSDERLTQYASGRHRDRIAGATVGTRGGRATWQFQVDYPAWGRYLLRVCDAGGGHCAGQVFYIDWPGWAGKAQEQSGPAASVLQLSADKARYTVGETAVLELPDGVRGRALLTLENGSSILDARWLKFDGGKRPRVKIPITAAMAPNVYAAVTLVQPHARRDNDRPIRLYGIAALLVENPRTVLQPVVETADTWKPRRPTAVTVREAKGRAMTYTLAVVDEGLLGITSYPTPRLHDQFYQREALGVLTWDLFDQVVGAYGADLERLLALGGGESAKLDPSKSKERRFPPVVRFYGPFRLAAGKHRTQEVTLPQYIGAVRVMAIAGHAGAYGSADKTVTVKEPVSVLVTLPRVLGPGEELDVPVSVFAFEPGVKQVHLTVEPGAGLDVVGPAERDVQTQVAKETQTRFRVRVAPRPGHTKLTVRAKGGPHETWSATALEIRPPNPPESRVVTHEIAPGQEWRTPLALHGMEGTNRAHLEVSAVPPLGLDYRLGYLVRYPYGCLEQITSAAFAQVALPRLVKLPPDTLRDVEGNVNSAIQRLRSFQGIGGAFSYWPGGGRVQEWADAYAGHFLVEARRIGYAVPAALMDGWLAHAAETARQWTTGPGDSATTQAYRLFVLALANKPDIGAMNRLREQAQLPDPGRWLLAAAYAHQGLPDPAQALVDGNTDVSFVYRIPGFTFGSRLRDRAVLLQALSLLGETDAADDLARKIARELVSDRWQSTQSLGFALSGLGRYVLGRADKLQVAFAYALGDARAKAVTAEQPIVSQPLAAAVQGKALTVANRSQRPLYATVTVTGNPPPGSEKPRQEELRVEVDYETPDGSSLDVAKMTQGQDAVAVVEVSNRSGRKLEHLALRQVVASGWEIANARLDSDATEQPGTLDYQDIRDDRVNRHFSLPDGESRTFKLRFTAAYAGRYYLPGVVFEDMYDAGLTARSEGQWVEIARP